MVPYIIGTILLIIILLAVGLILRKRIYNTVDRLEVWRMEIMNRNTAAELARIKGLNLSGETQEKFETWKERWEFIVANELPDISDLLFEVEDAADRYRFSLAKKKQQKVEGLLTSIEEDIEKMLGELEELLESEETSRKKIESLQPKLKDLQQNIFQNGKKFGHAKKRFSEVLQEIESGPLTYDELVESGNYLEAKDFVNQLKTTFETLESEVMEFPILLKKCTDDLPEGLGDLSSGLKVMKDEGYRVDQYGFEEEIHNNKQRLLDCIVALENGSTLEVKTIISEIEERITEMYDLLEEEAIARNYVEAQLPGYEKSLKKLGIAFSEMKKEVEVLRKAYYFEDHRMEEYRSLEKAVTTLHAELEKVNKGFSGREMTHSKMRTLLEREMNNLEKVEKRYCTFKEAIQSLRKDEIAAKEKLTNMRRQVNDLKRRIKQGNLPGVPNFIWEVIETATVNNHHVVKTLEKQPLDIGAVTHALEVAELSIGNAIEQIDMIIDQAYLTEQVIQYANRYRGKHPLLAAQLSEAERLFRSHEYESSLEHAARAIEEIEPGALKKIEANQVTILN